MSKRMGYNNWLFGGWVPASEGLWANSCSIQPWGSFRKLIRNKTKMPSSLPGPPHWANVRHGDRERERKKQWQRKREGMNNKTGQG